MCNFMNLFCAASVVGTSARIRSGHQRRLLHLIAHRPATVSRLAERADLALPHASTGLRKLRDRGWVETSGDVGERGAVQRLTTAGRRALDRDLSDRATRLGAGPDGAVAVVDQDGPMVVLAYASRVVEGAIEVPDRFERGAPAPAEAAPDSSGSRGGRVGGDWVAPLGTTRWFRPGDDVPVAPPAAPAGEGLDRWAGTTEVTIGVQAAVWIGPAPLEPPATGRWFVPGTAATAPVVLATGSWDLGLVRGQEALIRPTRAVWSSDRIPRAVWRRVTRGDAVVLRADEPAHEGPALPRSWLEPWLRRVHPRLDREALAERWRLVRRWAVRTLRELPSGRGPQATWRRWQEEWVGATWTRSEELPDMVTTGGLAAAAEATVLERLVDSGRPLVVVAPPQPSDALLAWIELHRGRLVLAIVPGRPAPEGWWSFERGRGWSLALDVDRRVALDLQLGRSMQAPETWEAPEAPSDMPTRAVEAAAGEPLPAEALDDHRNLLWEACRRWPDGDEVWANARESASPLAAWIATPPDGRWLRWQRIAGRIPPTWIELLDPSQVAFAALPALLATATPTWARANRALVLERARVEPRAADALAAALQDGGPTAAWAIAIALETRLLAGEPELDAPRALASLAATPAATSVAVLEALALDAEADDAGWTALATACERVGVLSGWTDLVLQADTPLAADRLPRLAELPTRWWSAAAAGQLSDWLFDPSANDALTTSPIPWPVVILRPPRPGHGAPGTGVHDHPPASVDLLPALRAWLGRADGSGAGTLALRDLALALEHSMVPGPPPPGRLHPDVGWLARPVERWPPFDERVLGSGHPDIAAALLTRRSGWHPTLTVATQTQLDVDRSE